MHSDEYLRCLKIMIRELLNNKRISFFVFITNLLIIVMLNFFRSAYRSDTWWTCNVLYLYFTSIIIPFVMFSKFSDKNRIIIDEIITTKLRKRNNYIFSYASSIMIGLVLVFILSNVILGALKIFNTAVQFDIIRNAEIIVANTLIITTFVSLFISLIYITKKYFITIIVYFLVVFILIINKSNAFLSLPYPYLEQFILQYFIGKLILLFLSGLMMSIAVKIDRYK